jgi:hypothetical protein
MSRHDEPIRDDEAPRSIDPTAPEPRPADDGALPELPPLAPHLRDRPDRQQSGRTRARSQNRLLLLLMFGAIPMIVVFVVVLNSLGSGPPDPSARGAEDSLNLVTRYCVYSAKPFDAYDACLNQTDARVVRQENSNAARYARAELTTCKADAGPRCTLR